jgi:hypothetical protein
MGCGGQGFGSDSESFELPEFGVLVFDVDRHVGVHAVQRGEEPRPELHVVAAADRDEVPARIPGPAVDGVPAAQRGGIGVGRCAGEPVVEDTVERTCRVDAGVLGGGVEDEVTEVVDRRYRVDALPEQVTESSASRSVLSCRTAV